MFPPVPWLLRGSSCTHSVMQTGYSCADMGTHFKLFNTTYTEQLTSTLNAKGYLEDEEVAWENVSVMLT